MSFFRTGLGSAGLGAAAVLALGLASASAETVLHRGVSGEPDTLDPHHASGTWENAIIGDMFLGLTAEAADGSVIPGAAESWTVSDDGLVYTFTLRDHSWSDGTPVTADDFVFGFKRILDPEEAAEYAYLMYTIDNAEEINTGALADSDALGVRAIDDRTLEVTLKNPAPFFIEQLTHYTAFPIPQHKLDELGDDWVKAGNIIGNNAYTVVEWVPNTHIKAVKNSNFYDADKVAIDTVYYYPTEERAAALKRFRAGELDINSDFPSDQIDWLKDNLPDETRIYPKLGIYYYPFNTRNPPFDDERIRQALSMAIDRTAITDKVLRTGEVPAYSFVPPGTGGYGDPAVVDWKDMPYDERMAKAKELLAEAGFGPDNPLELTLRYNTSENHKKVAIAVASMWKQLGVQTELFNAEVKVHYNDLQSGDFEVARAAWIADYNDPENFLSLLRTKTGVMNYGAFSNADFDRLMDQSDATIDQAARNDLMRQAEAIAMADMPIIPIYYYVSKNLVGAHVVGFEDNTRDIHRTRWLSVER
jgi:oligopeptide transport system substrate-binding protein